MIALRVATPVLERLAAGEACGVVRAATRTTAYVDLDGFVVALSEGGVALMANGVSVGRRPPAGAAARARPGRIDVGADAITWDRARPPVWEPALRRARPDERTALGRRGDAILAALGAAGRSGLADGIGFMSAPRGREGVRHLQRALVERDEGEAARAAERLLGLGGGLTPEGDDLLAATAAVLAATGEAVGCPRPRRDGLIAALVPADRRDRTTPLSATLLELAAAGRIAEPVHPLLDPADTTWRGAVARLAAVGASTGRAYAVGVGAALRALAA